MPRVFITLHSLTMLLLHADVLHASGLTLTAPSLVQHNGESQYIFVEFNASWDNSWRTSVSPGNWDAVWIFVKYRTNGGAWLHGTLDSSDHVAPAGSTIDPTPDGKGVFLFRSTDGTGALNAEGIRLRWNYGVDSVSSDASVEVKVLGIEMVYIPEGAFYVGDGSVNQVQGHLGDAATGDPFMITGESALLLGGTVSGNLGNRNRSGQTDLDDFHDTQTQPLPDEFPKGYRAFYCMKYEMSQGQYADFLNTISPSQASARYPDQNGVARHSITFDGSEYAASLPDVACNFVSWADVSAYMDWAGLRPWTELELEKAARGPETPLPDEYSFGVATATLVAGLTNAGFANESASNSTANLVAGNLLSGPMRVGWAAGGTREQASASYFGVLDISGNVAEVVVTLGNSTGRNFAGEHGDGFLTAGGESNTAGWPGPDAIGTGRKCGHWDWSSDWPRISARAFASGAYTGRTQFFGLRAVRTAP